MTTPDDIKQLGTILTVWAHPDDETFCAGGLMAAAVQNGQQVICVTATKGEAGIQDENKWPAKTLGATRASELETALQTLGVSTNHWLDYKDGACQQADADRASDKIKGLIEQYKPDTILTFGPEGMTGHVDHATISTWVDAAVKKSTTKPMVYHVVHTNEQYNNYLKKLDEKLNIFFNIDQPKLVDADKCGICFELTPELCEVKHQALACMPSQTEKMLATCNDQLFRGAFGTEAFIKAR